MALSIAPLGGRLDAAWAQGGVRREGRGGADSAAAPAAFAVAPVDGARALSATGQPQPKVQGDLPNDVQPRKPSDARETADEAANPAAPTLSPEEQQVVRELKARDSQVRAHEQAHISAAAGLSVSGPTYTFQRGPDGRNYAVGGEVRIDTSEEDSPRETADKAQRIQAAALAPADPSPQDRAVAAAAAQMEQRALAQISAERRAQAASTRADAGQAQNDGDASEPTAPAAASPLAQQRLAQTYGNPGPRTSRWLAAA